MSDVEIVVGIRGDASGGRVIKRNLDDIAQSGDKAISSTARLEKSLAGLKSAATGLSLAFGGLLVAMGFSRLGQISDQYTQINARLKTITGTTGQASAAFRDLKRISTETGSSIETSINIMQRLSFVRDEINATNRDMLNFTATVTKLGVLSNATSEAMKSGLTQLGQALSSEIMRAEEFNSIMENIPGVGKAIADELNVTTGQLRQLVVNGKVLSKDVFSAMLNSTERVREEFEKMPRTIERAKKEMGITFDGLIAKIMGTTNAADGYVKIIDFGTNRLKEMTATVDIIRITFETMGENIRLTFNNIAYDMQEIYNKASGWIYDMTNGRVDLGIKSDYHKIAFDKVKSDAEYRTKVANAIRGVMGEEYGPFKPNERRGYSQNYADIAKGLSDTTKLTKEQKEALKEQKRIQDQLTDAIKQSRTEQEQLYDKIAEMERLRPFAKTAEQVEAIEKNIANARNELDKLRIAAELKSPTAKAFASLASEIDKGFKDAFKSAFMESDGGFKKMLDGMKNTFKNFLAELAYQAMMRPIMVSVVGAVGGMMGLSGGAVNDVLGNVTGAPGILGGGTGGLSGVGSTLSGLLNGGLYSNTLGGIGSGIGNVLTGQAWGAMGPSMGASIGGGALGNMGYGAIGGGIASLLGLGNQNSMVNMLSGGLGSIAGGAIGTSMGTVLGMAGGPVGAIVGSFLGTALGGLFGGGKPSNKSQYGGIDLESLETFGVGGMKGKKYSKQNADFRDAVLNEAANLAKMFQSVGGETSGKINIHIGSRDGMWLFNEGTELRDKNGGYLGGNVSSSTRTNFKNDAAGLVEAVMTRVSDSVTGLSETFQTILDKVGVSDTAKLGQAFEFGKMYDAFLTEAATPAEVLQKALEELNKQLEQLQSQATELGLPIDKLTEAYEKQKKLTLDSIKAQMAGFSNLESMTKAFNDFLNGQALGGNSSLSPTQKLQLAQDNFGSLLEKAQGGDYSVTQELLKAANDLLNIGRGVYASSVSFAGLESFVRSSVTEIARASGVPGYANGTDYASSGLAMVGERGRELVQMGGGEKVWTAGETANIMAMSGSMATDASRTNAQLVNLNQEILEELRKSNAENTRMRKQMERLNNRMAVAS